MMYTAADVAALKSADVLQDYCRAVLGAGAMVGRVMYYPCPWGAHSRPKLTTAERDGVGVCKCWACGQGGTVFDVAAGVLGVDVRKDFAACVQAVADAVGYRLTEADKESARKGHRSRKAGAIARGGASTLPAPEKAVKMNLEYLPPEQEAAALEAVRGLRDNKGLLHDYAVSLGLPYEVLLSHTDIEGCAARGLLGMGKGGRLLYVYTHVPDDGEAVRVFAVKRRNLPGESPRFLMTGRKQLPWGMDSVTGRGEIFVTEGETDALAVRAALEVWLDIWLHTSPDDYPVADDLPAVVAKPDAGTFREAWARLLVGKNVTLVIDDDEAGRKGAAATAEILHAAGVRRVFTWTPPAGVKDARAALDAARPWLMADSLLTERLELIK